MRTQNRTTRQLAALIATTRKSVALDYAVRDVRAQLARANGQRTDSTAAARRELFALDAQQQAALDRLDRQLGTC